MTAITKRLDIFPGQRGEQNLGARFMAMFDGTMKPQEQAFVKSWIIQHKSKLNRRWRSQNFTRVDSALAHEAYITKRLINALQKIEISLKKIRMRLVLRKCNQSLSKMN